MMRQYQIKTDSQFTLWDKEATEKLGLCRQNKRLRWGEPCEYDAENYKYVASKTPIDVDDPYLSHKIGLDVESF